MDLFSLDSIWKQNTENNTMNDPAMAEVMSLPEVEPSASPLFETDIPALREQLAGTIISWRLVLHLIMLNNNWTI